MRFILQHILAVLAKALLGKYKPDVIGITGSVGKTSSKDAIALVLSRHFRVGKTEKNNNTEIGVPLTIIGGNPAPGRSIVAWILVCARAFWLLIVRSKEYPQALVLELGADRPGDIDYLTRLTNPRIGVLTAITPVHLEKFGSLEKLAEEKQKIFDNLSLDRPVAVGNADDLLIAEALSRQSVRVISYGRAKTADIRAWNIREHLHFFPGTDEDSWVACTVATSQFQGKLELDRCVGRHLMYAGLSALAVGLVYGISEEQMIQDLRGYQSQPGRMRLVKGLKQTMILDDTYNSSPEAAHVALDTLFAFDRLEGTQRIVVLGDMLELGDFAKEEHRELGVLSAQYGPDLLVTVGELGKVIADSAIEAGLDERRVFRFDDPVLAGQFVYDRIRRGDLILVKASQGMRLEHTVKELMAQPEDADDLLVRQGKEWQ